MEKKKVYFSNERINDVFILDIISSDKIGSEQMIFGGMDIDTFDAKQMRKISSEIKVVEEEGKEEDFNNKSQADFFTKTNDLETMYFKELDSIPLLTREAEVQIARRIENGLKRVSDVIFQSPITIEEVIQIGQNLKKGEIKLKEVIKDFEDEDFYLVEDAELRRICELIDQIRYLDNQNQELEKAECSLNKEGLIQTEFNKEKIRKILIEIRLNDNQIGKIVQKLKGFVQRIEIAEKEIYKIEQKTGFKLSCLERLFESRKREDYRNDESFRTIPLAPERL